MKNSKKIVIAAEIFPPDIGGPATYVSTLAEILVKRGYEVVVVTYADKPRALTPVSGYKLVRIKRRPATNVLGWLLMYLMYGLRLFWTAHGAQVIYTQSALSSGWLALRVARLRRTKVVVKIVGDQSWERAVQFGLTEKLLDEFLEVKLHGKLARMRSIQIKVLQAADGVITVSDYFKEIIAGWGIDPSKIFVVHNAVNRLPEPQAEAKPVLPSGDLILFVGRVAARWKGLDTMVGLMPELLKENQNFKLLIVGDGPNRSQLESLAQKFGVAENVIITGKVKHELLTYYYQRAMMFVLNSGYENWSHVLLEAMSYGVPVIASRSGGNKEMVADGGTGLLVDYDDKVGLRTAISKLWLNAELRESLAQNGQRQVRSHTTADMVEQTLKVLLSKP